MFGRLILSRNRKLRSLVPFLVQMQCDPGEEWTSKDVDAVSGTHRIKPYSTQDIPSRHLSHVIISADAIHIIVVGIGEDTAHPLLCQPRLARIRKQIRNMVNWFISLVVIVVPAKCGGSLFKKNLPVAGKTLPRRPSTRSVRECRGERTTSAGADCSPCIPGRTPSYPTTESIRLRHFSRACSQRPNRRSFCNFLRGLKIGARLQFYPTTRLVFPHTSRSTRCPGFHEICSGTYPCRI